MSSVVVKPGAFVFVTGVNGLIGSYIVDQLLVRGYKVRGAVRNVEKTKWLKEYFDSKFGSENFEVVEVPDMTIEGCYDNLLEGVEGFIHVASPVGGILDLDLALDIGRNAGINALKASAKTTSVKRFVNTSSSAAVSMPKFIDHDFPLDESMYNDEVLKQARVEESSKRNFMIYAAMKSETEKAMWAWMKENKPGFVMNSILPNANFGPVLIPDHQGYPSTIDWARAAWTGENFEGYVSNVPPQWFISVLDTALLHISALIHEDVNSERLFGYAERWDVNDLLSIYRKHHPEKALPEKVQGLEKDRTTPPTARAEEVLRWVKGKGWDGLEESVVAMSKDW
ncbi:hypothetical protein HBH98_057810 [Parastagonospora nodorum]|nr:hypothetical protein HBH53_131530 [Parastagonospora nodorum]KAH3973343.1 hypothetical protein HBH52_144410 [Parastagonospora nodorum]KAH4004346.1 hypothetical protein HBI10_051350 [Parastagonospora nodorum]KAH4018356.1 hypothetical protein HBI13_131770 [Parastagonospora nodorum]KAH4055509.1 hypothetical protein HBH49_060170 [Parastagonospora nodorum]